MNSSYIVHIIRQEKFTVGIVDFMKNKLPEYVHKFIIKRVNNCKYKLPEEGTENVYYIDSYFDLISNKEIKKLLNNSGKIIAEGIYGVDIPMFFWSKKLMKKTYMQFWGGDYYNLTESVKRVRSLKHKIQAKITEKTMISCIKRCKAVILLLETEYKDFVNATGVEKEYFVAPVANDGTANLMMEKVENNPKKKEPLQIIIGNSASESNYHKDALLMLTKYKDEDIRIFCPLSYGPKDYADEVAEYGKSLFGDKFFAVRDFMERDKYYEFLSGFAVGLYLNDRQEAMGNINALLRFGCKLYIRENTSMWDRYTVNGYYVNSINEIKELSFDEFVDMPKEKALQNRELRKKESDPSVYVKKWKVVLED